MMLNFGLFLVPVSCAVLQNVAQPIHGKRSVSSQDSIAEVLLPGDGFDESGSLSDLSEDFFDFDHILDPNPARSPVTNSEEWTNPTAYLTPNFYHSNQDSFASPNEIFLPIRPRPSGLDISSLTSDPENNSSDESSTDTEPNLWSPQDDEQVPIDAANGKQSPIGTPTSTSLSGPKIPDLDLEDAFVTPQTSREISGILPSVYDGTLGEQLARNQLPSIKKSNAKEKTFFPSSPDTSMTSIDWDKINGESNSLPFTGERYVNRQSRYPGNTSKSSTVDKALESPDAKSRSLGADTVGSELNPNAKAFLLPTVTNLSKPTVNAAKKV